jgi:hypothetical protein
MAEPEAEAAVRAELNRIAETQHGDTLKSGSDVTDELKGQATFRWLGDDSEAQRLREEQTHHYVQWAFLVALSVVIVGLIGVGLTFLR